MKQKKPLIGGVILLLVVITAGVFFIWRHSQRPEIRNVRWDMSPEQVKKRETAQIEVEKPDSLLYQTILFEQYPVALEYAFVHERLASIKYISLRKYASYQNCLADYRKIHNAIQVQHGRPFARNKEGDFQNSIWDTPQFRITMTLGKASQLIWILEYQKGEI